MTIQLSVKTPSHPYIIHIGSGLRNDFSLYQPYLGKRVFIVTNDTVANYYLRDLQVLLDNHHIHQYAIVLNDGEQYKNHDSLNQIYDDLLTYHADRQSTIIALGGGVIGDMAGFAAATYQRGIRFIQVPTTLLSQVDSSVGGKTAINHPLGKNMIGAFYQPETVIIDLETLNTLPDRELSAGLAEVIKYALLGDADFLQWLEHNLSAIMQRDSALLAHAIYHCCKMKAQIVAADETEQGIRALLNLGHTFGHAIETEMGYGNWLHGEAVAAGMVLASCLSEQLGYLKKEDTQRIQQLLIQANLPIIPPKMTFDRWISHMQHDKKVHHGKMRLITLSQLGQAQITEVEQLSLLQQTLAPYLMD